MRMNSNNKKNAQTILNDYDESDLDKVFCNYGDFKNSRLIAKNIVEHSTSKKAQTILSIPLICLFDKLSLFIIT